GGVHGPRCSWAGTPRLGEKSGRGGTVAGRRAVAHWVSQGEELARRDATEGPKLGVHVRLVAEPRVERHVGEPPRGRALQQAERAMEADDAAIELRRQTDLVAERLHEARFRQPRTLPQRRDRYRAAARIELRDRPGHGLVHAVRA